MKKFVFSLQVLLKVKLSLEKQQKAILLEIQQRIRALEAEMRELQERQALMQQEYVREAKDGIRSDRLQIYGRYFDRLREDINRQVERIAQAKAERAEAQEKLLRTMKEIKALNKLRERQYQLYLAELAREEEKAIGDLVSFKVASGEA